MKFWIFSSLVLATVTAVGNDNLVDVTSVKSHLEVLHDGKGHYVAHVPFSQCGEHKAHEERGAALFYGDGKQFWRLRSPGGGATCGESFDRSLWEPRNTVGNYAGFLFRDGKYQVRCSERTTEFTKLRKEERDKLLVTAVFRSFRWTREPYRLARDDFGNYYFVDKKRDEGRKTTKLDFHLWKGPRGNLKKQKMNNIVSDSAGDIFATKRGALRMIVNQDSSGNIGGKWVRGKKQTPLTVLPIWNNRLLIYEDLGVYFGKRLGTPCDDL